MALQGRVALGYERQLICVIGEVILQLLARGQLGKEWQELLEWHHNSALDFQAQKEASNHEAEHFNVFTDLAGFLRLKAGQTVIYKQDYFLQLWILNLENELVSLAKRTNVRVTLKSFYYVMDRGMGEVRRLEGEGGRWISKFWQRKILFSVFIISTQLYWMAHRIPKDTSFIGYAYGQNCFSHCISLNF